MTRIELLERLNIIEVTYKGGRDILPDLDKLIEDINEDGVLDVQAPPETHKELNLPTYQKD